MTEITKEITMDKIQLVSPYCALDKPYTAANEAPKRIKVTKYVITFLFMISEDQTPRFYHLTSYGSGAL